MPEVRHSTATDAASVFTRACDLAEEVRWRFDLERVVFAERLARAGTRHWIGALVVLGAGTGEWLLYATADLWSGSVLHPARVDAGGQVLEGPSRAGLVAAAARRSFFGLPGGPVVRHLSEQFDALPPLR